MNRVKKETGLGSSSTTLTTLASMDLWSPVEMIEAESGSFGLNQERVLGEGKGFSFSLDDIMGKEEGRRGEVADCQRVVA